MMSELRSQFHSAVEKCTDGNVLVRALPALMRQAGEAQPALLGQLKTALKSVEFPDAAMKLAMNTLAPASSGSPGVAALIAKFGAGSSAVSVSGSTAGAPIRSAPTAPDSTARTSSEVAGVVPPAKRQKLDMMRTLQYLGPSASAVAASGSAAHGAHREGQPARTTLYVCNILYTVDEAALKAFFENVFPENDQPNARRPVKIEFLQLYKTPAGKSKGSAKVVVKSEADFLEALKLNDTVQTGVGGGVSGANAGKLYVRDFFEQKQDHLPPNGAANASSTRTQQLPGEGEGADTAAAVEKASHAVVVKNLAFTATEANLGELFAGVGEISAVRIAKKDGRPMGFAVVEFSHAGAVMKALAKSGQNIKNRPVRIEVMRGAAGAGGGPAGPAGVAPGANGAAPTPSAAGAPPTRSTLADKLSRLETPAPTTAAGGSNHSDERPAPTTEHQSLSSVFVKKTADENLTFDKLVQDVLPKFVRDTDTTSTSSLADAFKSSAFSDEEMKTWLSAVGLKCGGTAEERLSRLEKIQSLTSFEEVPGALKAGKGKIKTNKPDCVAGNKQKDS
eukprot:g1970.t1